MRELHADIAKKQQIITCLGFRHILEEMPDRGEIVRHFVNPTPRGATGHWRMTWQFTIERELVLLLYEQVHRMAIPTTAPAAPNIDGSDALRQIILYDFEEWVKKHEKALTRNRAAIIAEYQKLKNAKIASAAVPTAVATTTAAQVRGGVVPPAPPAITTLYHSPLPPAAAATAAAAPAAGKANSLPETTFTHLFTTLNLPYGTWNCYERGLGLYSELSSSIHKYNKQYEVDETNWGRSDFLTLKWLKPTVDAHGRVNWNSIRAERNLPYTP